MTSSTTRQYPVTIPKELAKKLDMTAYWSHVATEALLLRLVDDALKARAIRDVPASMLTSTGEFVRIFVRLPDELDDRVRRYSEKHSISPGDFILTALWNLLVDQKKALTGPSSASK